MSNSISGSGFAGGDEEELVTLYFTLVDEDSFELGEDDLITPKAEFLKVVGEKLQLRGSIQGETDQLEAVKNKILEKVKERKSERRSRRDSVSSNSSKKRENSDHSVHSSSRLKFDL